MIHGCGARRPAYLIVAAALALLLLPGCLNPSGEPFAPVPTYVTSVKIDPRTLEPFDEKAGEEKTSEERTDDEKTGGEKSDAPAPE